MKRKLLSFLFFSLGVCSLWAQDLALVDSLEQQKSLYEQLKKEDEEEYEFRNAYQELAVGILGNKYSYTQVRESGLMIAAKDKALGYILACKTTEEMYKEIGERAEQIHRENRRKQA